MTKKSKMVHIIALIILILEFIMFPLVVILGYFFVLIPQFGFSYFSLMLMVGETVIFAFLGWSLAGQCILKHLTLLLSEKIKGMEKDDGREEKTSD